MILKSKFIIPLLLFVTPLHAEPVDEGKEIFLNRCGMCHKYPEPSALNAKQWRFVLKKMQKRMEFMKMVPLTEEENMLVYDYLSRMAR